MAGAGFEVRGLKCEYGVDPLGIEAWPPRLSWQVAAGERRGAKQAAYQLRAAGTAEAVSRGLERVAAGDDLWWDSGRVDTDESLFVPYGGPRLGSGARCYWQVRAWDEAGRASAWSKPAFFEMGLLRPEDWVTPWIEPGLDEDVTQSGPAPLLRGEFMVAGEVRRARAYVTSRGLYEAWLNGARVSDWLYRPGWTSYTKRVQYQTYDITAQLRPGPNALGALLGDGWYRGYIGSAGQRNTSGERLGLRLMVVIDYADGRRQVAGTGPDWQAAYGPIRRADNYNGEYYDARLERAGWTEPGYADAGWTPVVVAEAGTALPAVVVAQDGPSVRRMLEVPPAAVSRAPDGGWLLDFGQNLTGWLRLRVQGPRGTEIVLRHAELLDAAGGLYTTNLNTAQQTDTYVLKGEGTEEYEPRFTFHGFRYATVSGYPGERLPEGALTAIVIHSDMARTGEFECSHLLINQLQRNIGWSQRGNFVDVPTDCPQRDERCGYTGDAQIFLRTGAFNFDVAGVMVKWLKDVAADTRADGAVPHLSPDVSGGKGASGWGDAAVIVPWQLYQAYGDAGVLAQQYTNMTGWVDYLRAQAGPSHILRGGFQYGDWVAVLAADPRWPNPVTNYALIGTAYYAYSAGLLAQAAAVLGKDADAARYAALHREVRAAFQREFVTPAGRVGSDTQTGYVLPLAFGLLDEAQAAEAARRLAQDVRERGHQLTTGFLGTAHLPHVLSDYGYLAEAYALLERTEFPSWLYPITRGATTVWERWDGIRPDGTLQDPAMNSFNHYAYGAVGDWLYRVAAGIDMGAPGYKAVVIRPRPGGSLTWAKAAHEGPYGRIEARWRREAGTFALEVLVPANTTARVYLPARAAAEVTEGGAPLSAAAGVLAVAAAGEAMTVVVGSGRYSFEVREA